MVGLVFGSINEWIAKRCLASDAAQSEQDNIGLRLQGRQRFTD